MVPHGLPTRRRALVVCAFVALIAVICAGIVGAAVLVPAPPAVLPLLVLVCIGCPMAAACELPAAIAALRRAWRPSAHGARALRTLRRELDTLPEARHPLGL
jgi:hypothetical protein